MTARERVLQLVGDLSEDELDAAERLLRPLRSRAGGENGKRHVPTVAEVLDRLHSEMTPEELESLPTDIGSNLDHYVYGTPKQGPVAE